MAANWFNSIESQVTLGDTVYGAAPDARGPIGGGLGYVDIFTSGDYTATTLEELVSALSTATSGEVVYIPDETVIDLTSEHVINQTQFLVPGGVTVAGNRGYANSLGAAITSDALDTSAIFKTLGTGCRFTGLRITGPNPKTYQDHYDRCYPSPPGPGSSYYNLFPASRGIWDDDGGAEVDNCELSSFGHVAIYLYRGDNANIHHNYIHHCQYNGLGYGVGLRDATSVTADYNLFDYMRHSITSTGNPLTSYTATNNIQLENCTSQSFDVHEGSTPGVGGDYAIATNNTFYNRLVDGTPYLAIKYRGVPTNTNGTSLVTRNWFAVHETVATAVDQLGGVTVADNAYIVDIKEQPVP